MSEIKQDEIAKLLGSVTDPVSGKGLMAAGIIAGISVTGKSIRVILQLQYDQRKKQIPLAEQCKTLLQKNFPGFECEVLLTAERKPEQDSPPAAKPAQWNLTPLENVNRVIAVGSGKGGVGKSTVSVWLAMALAAKGFSIGLLDADIQGPSIPRMLGLLDKPVTEDGYFLPLKAHGIEFLSMGSLLRDNPAVIRGPMVTKALLQLLRGTKWGKAALLDILLIDLPPGTGDIQLSLAQQAPLSYNNGGAILVTTPQPVAVDDALKCAEMFKKIDIPVLGVVENMSRLDINGQFLYPFGEGGGKLLAGKINAPLIAQLPLEPEYGRLLDTGNPQLPPAFVDNIFNLLNILSK